MDPTNQINIAFINIRGQTGLNLAKQVQLEDFIKQNRIDILHLQESNIEENTFSDVKSCFFRSSWYGVVSSGNLQTLDLSPEPGQML